MDKRKTLIRNVKVRMSMLSIDCTDIAKLLDITKQSVHDRYTRKAINTNNLRWLGTALAVPMVALTDPDPTRIGSVPLPADGWFPKARTLIKAGRPYPDFKTVKNTYKIPSFNSWQIGV